MRVTASDTVSATPSALATIRAVPSDSPVTIPACVTATIVGVGVDQETTRPGGIAPCTLSSSVTEKPRGMPMRSAPVRGVTTTCAMRGSTAVTTDSHPTPGYSDEVTRMRASPARRVVTSPLGATVATASLSLVHTVGRPTAGSGAPAVSRSASVGCALCPTVRRSAVGVRAQLPIGISVTVIAARPTVWSLSAVISASPAATAVTSPVWSTLAIALLLLLQRKLRPPITAPWALRAVAVSRRVLVRRSVTGAGVTVTVAATSGVTVTCALPLFPFATAETVAVPTPTPMTAPPVVTVATAALLDE